MLPEGAPTLSSLSDFNRDFFNLDGSSLATLIHIGNCKSRESCQYRQHGKSDEHFCHTAAKAAEAITMSEIENQINYENYKSRILNCKYL